MRLYPNVWSEFIRSAQTLSLEEGVLEEWHKGRTAYALWILRIESKSTISELRNLQESLAKWIDPVTEFHITTWVSGFPSSSLQYNDDVLERDLQKATKRVGEGSTISVKLGHINSFQTSAFVEVEDHRGHIHAIRKQLNTHKEIRFAPFIPHITLGNYTDKYDTPLIKSEIERLEPPFAELYFNSVEWVEFSPQGCRKTLKCIKRIHRRSNT